MPSAISDISSREPPVSRFKNPKDMAALSTYALSTKGRGMAENKR